MILKEENTKTYQKGFRDGMLNSLQHNVNLMNSQIDSLADDSSSTKNEVNSQETKSEGGSNLKVETSLCKADCRNTMCCCCNRGRSYCL